MRDIFANVNDRTWVTFAEIMAARLQNTKTVVKGYVEERQRRGRPGTRTLTTPSSGQK